MNSKLLLECAMISVFVLSLGTLGIMWGRRAFRDFSFLGVFLAISALSEATFVPLIYFRKYLGIDRALDYKLYFYSSWIYFVVEYAIVLLVIHGIYRIAMRPFEGLQKAGKLVFRWAFGVSLILSCGLVAGGHIGPGFWASFNGQIHQVVGILALCLLLFVTFAVRYLGLTYRSRLFGVSLGYGVWATTNLMESALLTTKGALTVYSPIYLWGTLGYCATIVIWGAYFALPEPERKLILLPTTSPFFFWNRISEALGDDPGHVVVGGFTPEMLAKGELEVLTAASRFAKSREDRSDILSASPNKLQSAAAQR